MFRRVRALLACSAFLISAFALCAAQDVPQGVTYKKASPLVNARAKSAVEQALAANAAPESLMSGVISCGPILWGDLKDHQFELSKDSTPISMMLSVPDPIKAEGRGFRTQEQRNRFWNLVLQKYPDLKKGVVRPAKANEIQFYWTTIPFDIEEPFFAIQTPSNVFIANLRMENGAPVLFSLDRVDDLRKLKK